MNSSSLGLSQTSRQPHGPIETLPDVRIGLIEIYVAASEGSDATSALIRHLSADIIKLITNDPNALSKLIVMEQTA